MITDTAPIPVAPSVATSPQGADRGAEAGAAGETGAAPRRRALVPILGIACGLLALALAAAIVLLVVRGAPAPESGPTPSAAAAASEEEAAAPAPEAADSEPHASAAGSTAGSGGGAAAGSGSPSTPVAPPVPAVPAFTGFQASATAIACADDGEVHPVTVSWSSVNATAGWFGVDTADASAAPLQQVSPSGSFTGDFFCGNGSTTYTVTVADQDGRLAHRSVTVSRV
jgi:hypothetical protein